MNEQTIEMRHGQILALLKDKRLKEAHVFLDNLLQESGDWKLRNRLETARLSHRYMLQYMRQGTDDPQRGKLYRQLLVETLEIADQARVCLLDDCSTHYYHTLRKSRKEKAPFDLAAALQTLESHSLDLSLFQFKKDDLKELLALQRRHEKATDELFLSIWINSAWSVEEERQAGAYLTSTLLGTKDLCLVIGAVMLSITACFDARKFAWLLEALAIEKVEVNQRALVAVAILLLFCHERIPLYPELEERFDRLKREGDFTDDMVRVYMQLIRTLETDNIAKKVREEIIPDMMKSMEGLRQMGLDFDEIDEENDNDPAWELEETMEKNMQDLNTMQVEGFDVNMATLGQLKGFPFFQKLSNWFYPFDPNQSLVLSAVRQRSIKERVVLGLLMKTDLVCDSDKYSFCFTTLKISEEDSNILMKIDPEAIGNLLKVNDDEKAERLTIMYIQDLYRFFKLHPLRAEFSNPFKEEIAPYRLPYVKALLDDPKLMLQMADFLFAKGNYKEASELYIPLTEQFASNFMLFQKAGFCLQKQKRYQEAVDLYQRADILKPERRWTVRHIATCYRMLHNYDYALTHYMEAYTIDPEDGELLFQMGSCAAALQDYEEALQNFCAMEFIGDVQGPKVWRAIGWCSFMSGKMEQARKYYDKLLTDKPTSGDYLNAGHVAWCSGDVDRAVELYTLSQASIGHRQAFLSLFGKDKETLLEKGIKEEEIPLMLDLIGEE